MASVARQKRARYGCTKVIVRIYSERGAFAQRRDVKGTGEASNEKKLESFRT